MPYVSMRHRHRATHSTPPELTALVGIYLRNFIRSVGGSGEFDRELVEYLREAATAGSPVLGWPRVTVPVRSGKADPHDDDRLLKSSLRFLRRLAATPMEPAVLEAGHLERNLGWFCDVLALDATERSVLLAAVTLNLSLPLMQCLFHGRTPRREDVNEYLAAITALPVGSIRSALDAKGTLVSSGLLRLATAWDEQETVEVDQRLADTLLLPNLTPDRALDRFLSREPAPVLSLADYGPLAPSLELITRLLRNATARREKGINVLLYGPTGVGKTEAARLVGGLAGLSVYLAGDDVGLPGSPSARSRLASLSMGNLLLRASESVMVFDELEAIVHAQFVGSSHRDGPLSKLWLNRLFEGNAVPVIWTSNSIASVDPAMLRRFTVAIEFPTLGERQRRTTWQGVAGGLLPGERLDALAREHEISPAEIATAVRTARLGEPGTLDEGLLDLCVNGASRLRGGPRPTAQRAGGDYRLDAVNASRDLLVLSEKLAAWRPGSGAGISLCLYGRSGTGKSEYVHYLARRLDRPLLVRNVSDLLSKWVGDTERAIASAFAQAHREGALLLFDEIDSFLKDRRGMQSRFEQSQANEFLQQLEACTGFVAVTTNLFRDLDPAVLRRFVFKVEFLPLRPEQRAQLWDAHLAQCLEAPLDHDGRLRVQAALSSMNELVPGDFALVSRRQRVLGERTTASALLGELAEEVSSRRHDVGRSIGFRDTTFGFKAGDTARASRDWNG